LFSDIVNSATGKQRFVAFFGNTDSNIIKVEGAKLNHAVLPVKPANTALISYILVSDISVDVSGFALKADLGNKSALATTSKNSVVQAVNEINGKLNLLQSDQITLSIFKISNYGTL